MRGKAWSAKAYRARVEPPSRPSTSTPMAQSVPAVSPCTLRRAPTLSSMALTNTKASAATANCIVPGERISDHRPLTVASRLAMARKVGASRSRVPACPREVMAYGTDGSISAPMADRPANASHPMKARSASPPE